MRAVIEALLAENEVLTARNEHTPSASSERTIHIAESA